MMTETFAQHADRVTIELTQMADLLEVKDFENEYDELIENARYTADHNPISETAYDIQQELMTALRSY